MATHFKRSGIAFKWWEKVGKDAMVGKPFTATIIDKHGQEKEFTSEKFNPTLWCTRHYTGDTGGTFPASEVHFTRKTRQHIWEDRYSVQITADGLKATLATLQNDEKLTELSSRMRLTCWFIRILTAGY